MDLFNQTLNSFFAQISDRAIGLNPDIFETNVINIILLLGSIIYLGSDILLTSLSIRKRRFDRKFQSLVSVMILILPCP
jgi:hypothetical protein